MIGNDVVDLDDPESRSAARHARFDARAFTVAEQTMLRTSADGERLRWVLWAAKESAYKAARRDDARVTFAPARVAAYEILCAVSAGNADLPTAIEALSTGSSADRTRTGWIADGPHDSSTRSRASSLGSRRRSRRSTFESTAERSASPRDTSSIDLTCAPEATRREKNCSGAPRPRPSSRASMRCQPERDCRSL